jgi:hypothetical protein
MAVAFFGSLADSLELVCWFPLCLFGTRSLGFDGITGMAKDVIRERFGDRNGFGRSWNGSLGQSNRCKTK